MTKKNLADITQKTMIEKAHQQQIMEEVVTKIRNDMFAADFDSMDKVIEKYKLDMPGDKDLANLSSLIIQRSFGLLSFRTVNPNQTFKSVAEVEGETLKRELKLLSFLSLEGQLYFLSHEMNDTTHDHLSLIKKKDISKHIKDNNKSIFESFDFRFDLAGLLADNMRDNNFDVLDEIINIFKIDFNHKCDFFYFSYKTKNSTGSSLINFKKPIPLYAICSLFLNDKSVSYFKDKNILDKMNGFASKESIQSLIKDTPLISDVMDILNNSLLTSKSILDTVFLKDNISSNKKINKTRLKKL